MKSKKVIAMMIVGLVAVFPAGNGLVAGTSLDVGLLAIEAESKEEQFRFVDVTLVIKDTSGDPIENAEVKAFSEDWGIKYPYDWGTFYYTDENGKVSIEVPVGNWSFYAGGGNDFKWSNPGEGYFSFLTTQITSNTTLELRPSDTIHLALYDMDSQPLDIEDVYLMESNRVPMTSLPICGRTQNGEINVQVTGESYDILLVKRPSSLGYLLHYENIPSGGDLVINLDSSDLSHLTFDCYDTLYDYTTLNIGITLPYMDMDRCNGFFDFNVDGTAEIYVSPMSLRIHYRNIPPDWYYFFVGKGYDLEAGTDMTLQYGGPVTVDVRIQQQNTQIWLLVRDAFGNIMDFYNTPKGEPHIPIRLTQDSAVVYEGEIEGWLQGRLDITYEEENSPLYEIELDLGPSYGVFDLTGVLLSDETAYGYANAATEHFIVHGPYGFEERIEELAQMLEGLCSLYEYFNNEPLDEVIHGYIDISPFAAGYAGRSSFHVWLGGFLWFNSSDPSAHVFEGVVLHELGHVFQLSPPNYYFISSWYGEPNATYLGYNAIEQLRNAKFEKWRWGCHPGFFKFLSGDTEVGVIERTQFILFYLEDVYGEQIHRDFVRAWNSETKSILTNAGFNDEESVIVLYSYLANGNLAWLFQLAGFDITDERIAEALGLLKVEVEEIQLYLQAGWNMVSVPLTLSDNSTSAVFPGVAGVFTWNATATSREYYEPTVINPEKGYWVAVTENTMINISGTPIETWTTDIKAGWNMIGSVATNSSIADPNDGPDGSVEPNAYWWDPIERKYIETIDIEPGKGYWIASLNDCALTL